MRRKKIVLSAQELQTFKDMKKSLDEKRKIRNSLTGKEKELIDLIENVKCDIGYIMKVPELVTLINLHDNNLAEGAYDLFRYGYLKGKMAAEKQHARLN